MADKEIINYESVSNPDLLVDVLTAMNNEIDLNRTLTNELKADMNTNKAILDEVKTLVNDIRAKVKGNYVITKTGIAIGSTVQNVANGAFDYLIGGVRYSKAAVAAGTALSGDTLPDGKYGAWALEIGVDGTVDILPAADNGTGYASEADAIAGIPAASADHAIMGYVTVLTSGATFEPGTTGLDAATVTDKYYDWETAFELIGDAISGTPAATAATDVTEKTEAGK